MAAERGAKNRFNYLEVVANKPLAGIVLALALALVGYYTSQLFGNWSKAFNDVIIVIGLGFVVRNTLGLASWFEPGLQFCLRLVLRLAIILLGLQLNLTQVWATGSKALVVILVVVGLALPLTLVLGQRLGVSRRIAVLIGVGSAICGASAILATGPAIGAKEKDIGLAVATVFLFNTLALLVYPLLGYLLGLTDLAFGTWVGTAVQDVSSVVAVGFAYSNTAGAVATVVKLARTVLIVPVVMVVSLLFNRKQESAGKKDGKIAYTRIFPWFVLGFVLLAVINSTGWAPPWLGAGSAGLTHWLILIVMAAVGLGLDLREMRQVGWSFLLLGLKAMGIMAGVSLLLIKLLRIT